MDEFEMSDSLLPKKLSEVNDDENEGSQSICFNTSYRGGFLDSVDPLEVDCTWATVTDAYNDHGKKWNVCVKRSVPRSRRWRKLQGTIRMAL